MSKKQARLIIVSAPSGCGKTTIVKQLLERNPGLMRSISHTTRPPRPGEREGKDYFFISPEAFESKKKNGFFLECASVFGHRYGTSKTFVLDQIAAGRDIVLAIDVQGMNQLKGKLTGNPPTVSIFIMPPSLEALRERLRRRQTEDESEIEKRLGIAEKEMKERTRYDHVIVNEQVEQAVKAIERILK